MDRSGAVWNFYPGPPDYGIRIVLQNPAHEGVPDTSAVAIIMHDWPATRIASALGALEDAYAALPEPPSP